LSFAVMVGGMSTVLGCEIGGCGDRFEVFRC